MNAAERPSTDRQVHRALSSPVRVRLLELLRARPGGEPAPDAGTLAAVLDLHVNTVRAHLQQLEDAGLVESAVEERRRPGRPRLLYRALPTPHATTPGAAGGYPFLAAILASYLRATSEDSAAAAEQAGRAWGKYVVERPAPFTTPDPDTAVERLVEMLDDVGFAPEVDRTDPHTPQIVLRRCPFLDVAREHEDVVCAVHLGLMRGALDELGVGVEARELVPWARPDGCVAHLRM